MKIRRRRKDDKRVCEPPLHRTFPLEVTDARGRKRFIGHGCECERVRTTPAGSVSRYTTVVAGRLRRNKSDVQRVAAHVAAKKARR